MQSRLAASVGRETTTETKSETDPIGRDIKTNSSREGILKNKTVDNWLISVDKQQLSGERMGIMFNRKEKNKRHTSWNSFIRRRTNKFGATPTGGYASKKEYWDAVFLKDLEAQGIISNLRQQVRFDFRINGKLLKHYAIVDFQFEINGKVVWYETKGFVDKVYPLKREIIEATLADGHVYLVNASEQEIRNV